MKLLKGRWASLPGSSSTSSLPPSTFAEHLSPASSCSALAPTVDIEDAVPVSSTKSHMPSKGNAREGMFPPSSFSLGRSLGLGLNRKHKSKGRQISSEGSTPPRNKVNEEPVHEGDLREKGQVETDKLAIPKPILAPARPSSDIHTPISPLPPLLSPGSSSPRSNTRHTLPIPSDDYFQHVPYHASPRPEELSMAASNPRATASATQSSGPAASSVPCLALPSLLESHPDPSLTRSASKSSLVSGDSHQPLIQISSDVSSPHRSPPSKKLVKRKPVPEGYQNIDTYLYPSSATEGGPKTASDAIPAHQLASTTRDADPSSHPPPTTLTRPPSSFHGFPEGQSDSTNVSGLDRNPSSSTTNSSSCGPSTLTEESILLETPNDTANRTAVVHRDTSNEMWRVDHEDSAVPIPNASNSSSLSYVCRDDQSIFGLQDFLASDTSAKTTRPALKSPHSPKFTGQRLSDTRSIVASTISSRPSSSFSSARRQPRRISSSPPTSTAKDAHVDDLFEAGSRRSMIVFETTYDANIDRRKAQPSMVRLRSASFDEASSLAPSMYSLGEVTVANQGVFTSARTFPSRDPDVSPPRADAMENGQRDGSRSFDNAARYKDTKPEAGIVSASDEAVRQAHIHKPLGSPSRTSLATRRAPPPPPHLARSLKTKPVVQPACPALCLSQEQLAGESASPARHTRRPSANSDQSLTQSNSFGRLWRRFSHGSASEQKRKSSEGERNSETKTPSPSKRSSSLLIGVPGVNSPELPPPISPVDIKKLIRKASKVRMKPPKLPWGTEEPLPRAHFGHSSVEASSTIKQPDIRVNGADGPGAQAERISPEMELPLAAGPLLRVPIHASPLELRLDDNYFTRKRGPSSATQSRASVTFDPPQDPAPSGELRGELPSPGSEAKEKRRRYRQTLVDIKDDDVFHKVLADLARIESQTPTSNEPGDPSKHPSEPDMLEMRPHSGLSRSPSDLIGERKAREESIRAWFVTREIVQGERRYGRLLARGVAIIRSTAQTTRIEIPPLPISKVSQDKRRSGKSRQNPQRRGGLIDERHPTSETSKPDLPSISSSVSPFTILLEHLPRLLAVSLTLSSRFEHDPSPVGVAQSFGAMERELSSEMGLWAGEVGNLVAMGLGEVIDRKTPASSRRASMSAVTAVDVDPDERLGFADIILMPVMRALRYKLLFKELLDQMPHTPAPRETVERALCAAEKLAVECDRKQQFDLEDLRRTSGASGGVVAGEAGRKQKKKRTRSMGPAVRSSATVGRAC